MQFSIRDATPSDGKIIAEYNCRLCRETENRELERNLIEPGVDAVLRDTSKGRYWVAVCGEKIIGQILITYEWSDWRNGMLWWIGSVYVHADFRRQGVYSRLYKHVEQQARDASDVAGLRLYVEKENRRAQSTYEHLGMSYSDYRLMQTIF